MTIQNHDLHAARLRRGEQGLRHQVRITSAEHDEPRQVHDRRGNPPSRVPGPWPADDRRIAGPARGV